MFICYWLNPKTEGQQKYDGGLRCNNHLSLLAALMLKKENFPRKICVTCQHPFVWRKKWQAIWHEVKHCSHRCRQARNHKPLNHF